MMKYNLLNIATFKELPKIIKKLYVIHDNYEYFSTASVNIIIDLTITVLNCTADVITFDRELIRLGDYARRESVKYGINRDRLLDFIQIVDGIHRKIEYDNRDLLQNK